MTEQRSLTSAQRRYLAAVEAEDLSTAELAIRFKSSADAARKVMQRLEARGLAKSEGTGDRRIWSKTKAGSALLDEGKTETEVRPYHVFEETSLGRIVADLVGDSDLSGPNAGQERFWGDILKLLDGHPGIRLVTECEARNTEHACRQAGKAYEDDLSVDLVTMMAVPSRSWKPTPVRINTTRTVSVG